MHSTGPHPPRPPHRRRRALLVLLVLVGLLGMHALGPGGSAGHVARAWSAHAVALTSPDACAGDDGHCGGGMPHHADPTCASGAVTGGPQLPALVPDPVAAPAADVRPRPRAVAEPAGARAPPSLAELQLLRI
ncbi:DUF6153 family protein [Streptomyces monashensis]|uniref:Uncharacterized protein n=1 Tax=Streptomyces monashensis TaxID=1678012 RepID=A0A1S2QM75_9ACTN|nr:DUF6153 family protein [Streptomyces monashensis]OIK06747.1 hypothetical protein BIV23_07090 [Streptomyces monashensis]